MIKFQSPQTILNTSKKTSLPKKYNYNIDKENTMLIFSICFLFAVYDYHVFVAIVIENNTIWL